MESEYAFLLCLYYDFVVVTKFTTRPELEPNSHVKQEPITIDDEQNTQQTSENKG